MESFSWVSEGPSPLKETQTVKKMFLQMIKSRGHHPRALKYMFMYMKLGLQRRISPCEVVAQAAPRTLAMQMHALASALRLDCTAARLLCVFTGMYSLGQ